MLKSTPLIPWPTQQDKKTIVVVGSGITGLACGALFAHIGHRVQVLEAHADLIGGHARTFDLDGARICAGPQYVWNFQDDQIGQRVLRFLGLEQRVPFDELEPTGFERVQVGRTAFDVPMGLDRFRDKLVETFPEHTHGLHQFFELVGGLAEGAQLMFEKGYYLHGNIGMTTRVLASPQLSVRAKRILFANKNRSLGELFDRCKLPPVVRRILYAHGGIFAENESDISAVVYAGATGLYHAGARFPRFGFESLINALASVIRERGGEVLTGKKVVHLAGADGTTREVLCADTTRYPCDFAISNLSPRLTAGLVSGGEPRQFTYGPSNPLVLAFMKTGDPGVPKMMARRNIWWHRGEEAVDYSTPDMTRRPELLYLASQTANRGTFASGMVAGEHTMTVCAPGNFEQARRAAGSGRGEHERLRETIQERLVQGLEEIFPNIRERIQAIVTQTPWDIFTELGAEGGNVYGRRMDAYSMLHPPLSSLWPTNLRLANATVGVPGVASGVQQAAHILRNLTGVSI